jgi:putative oxidoreductase
MQLTDRESAMNAAAAIVVRLVMGAFFFVAGLNEFLRFIPLPELHGAGLKFLSSMTEDSRYFYVWATAEMAGGALLLIGRYVPLGLTLLGPVIVNIVCFHLFMNPTGLPGAVVVSALALFLFWRYRTAFPLLLKP